MTEQSAPDIQALFACASLVAMAMNQPLPDIATAQSFFYDILHKPRNEGGRDLWGCYWDGIMTAAELRDGTMARIATWLSDRNGVSEPSYETWRSPDIVERFERALFGLPLDLESLQRAVNSGRTFSYRYFWGHTSRGPGATDACFSQWWPSSFTVRETTFPTAEHFMMFAKACVFGDTASRERIVASVHPREAKELGRHVSGFSEQHWASVRFDIVTFGNYAKFSQNPELAAYLQATGDAILVEASPQDTIWGIGLGEHDEEAANPRTWRGMNLLGFSLMRVRRVLNGEAQEPELPFDWDD